MDTGLLRRVFFGLFPLAGTLLTVATASAYTPEDPVVRGMVDKGLKYLTTVSTKEMAIQAVPGVEEGTEMLMGYAAHKAGRGESDPLVHHGIQVAVKAARKDWSKDNFHVIYDNTLACLLLADVDPKLYRPELEKIVATLVKFQKPQGGFGYPSDQYNDVSQIQYAMLALWTADRAGVEVPPGTMDRALNWLIRTQPNAGGFMYRPRDPMAPEIQPAAMHSVVTHSLTFAGMGTVLIAGDFFQFFVGTGDSAESLGLPAALRRVRETKTTRRTSIRPDQVDRTVRQAFNWVKNNAYKRDKETWHYYMMYAAERYYSFMELAEGNQPEEPEWYNQGVEELRKAQQSNGAWGDGPDVERSSPAAATALAVLFLVRSTKKAIGTINEGMAAGGFGLPKDTANAKENGSQITGDPVAVSLNDMLAMLEDEDDTEVDPNEIPPALALSKDAKERGMQLQRLERLARGQAGDGWLARRVAVRTLAASGELNVAPTLIFALSDGDKKVRLMARDGLRMISRRFDGVDMKDDATPDQIIVAQDQWKEWYLNLNPTYVFIE